MKRYALLLSIVTATGCEFWPPGLPGADAGVLDGGSLDASSDAGDSGLVRDGGATIDVDAGDAPVDVRDAAVPVDAAVAADGGDDPLLDSGVAEDAGSASDACDAPPWILDRCGVARPRRGVLGAELPVTPSAGQLACIEHWLAKLER
jgi:hypothetical protein